MDKKLVEKIIGIIDIEFDTLFYTYMVKEKDIKFVENVIEKRLESL